MIIEYYCSKHYGEGNPDCQECWDKLINLCQDNNALLLNEEGQRLT